MARIAGVDLPREKRVEIGLTYIYGIGRSKSNEILSKTGINPDTRVRDLTDDEVGKLRDIIDKEYVVEGNGTQSVLRGWTTSIFSIKIGRASCRERV